MRRDVAMFGNALCIAGWGSLQSANFMDELCKTTFGESTVDKPRALGGLKGYSIELDFKETMKTTCNFALFERLGIWYITTVLLGGKRCFHYRIIFP